MSTKTEGQALAEVLHDQEKRHERALLRARLFFLAWGIVLGCYAGYWFRGLQ